MKQPRSALLTKLRISVSIAIVAITVMVSLTLEERVPSLMERRAEILEAAVAVAALLLILGRFVRPEDDDEESPFRFLRDFRYGAVMTLLSGLLFYVTTHDRPAPVLVAKPKSVTPVVAVPVVAPVVTAAAPVVTARTPRAFPSLKLQGLTILNGTSYALINKKQVEVGETIDDVKVVAITRDSVAVELDGQTKTLRLYSLPLAGGN